MGHPALGDCRAALTAALSKQMPHGRRAEREAERERIAIEQARIREEAAQAWAHQEVVGTLENIRVRHACESLGAALWQAGVDVNDPMQNIPVTGGAFEGLLANTTAIARADDDAEEALQSDDEFTVEFQYDDVVGYIDDYRGAKEQRRAEHGAPRRVRTEKTWLAGEKVQARAPARARKQKQALVASSRHNIADARRVRMLRRSAQRTQHVDYDDV